MEAGCQLFSHNDTARLCLIYSIQYPSPESFTPGYNATYYQAARCFRSDYTYVQSINACVKVHNDFVSINEAMDICRSENEATLFITNTSARFDFMREQLDIYGVRFWLGGIRDDYPPFEWRWVNGDVITEQNGGKFWLPDQPNSGSEYRYINVCYSNFDGMYGYYNVEVFRNKRFICEKPAFQ